jgi:hypothetical protein
MGAFSLTMRLAMAEYEANLISEKIAHRYVDRRRASQPMNSPPFGYALQKRLSGTGVELQLVPHPERAVMARAVIDAVIRLDGQLNAVLRECQFERMPRSSRGLRLWLGNRVLLGHTIYNPGESNEDVRHHTHEPLLSEDEFYLIQSLLERRSRPGAQGPRDEDRVHPLVGVARCPSCGMALTASTRAYVCSGSSTGRYRRTAGQRTIRVSWTCRYINQGRCSGVAAGTFSKDAMQALTDLTIERLCGAAEALVDRVHQIQDPGVSAEERQLMEQIEAMRRLNQALMAPAIRALEDQLEQVRFKEQGMERHRGARQQALMAADLTVEGFKSLSGSEQNELLRAFVLRAVPACGDRPALVELLV